MISAQPQSLRAMTWITFQLKERNGVGMAGFWPDSTPQHRRTMRDKRRHPRKPAMSCQVVGRCGRIYGTDGQLAAPKTSTVPAMCPSGRSSAVIHGRPRAPFSFLTAVSCASSSACSAVGGYGNSSGTQVALAERWDGTSWVIQPTPRLPGGASLLFGLTGVACTSATGCTAVGLATPNHRNVVNHPSPDTLAER